MLHPLVGMQKRGRSPDAKLKTPMGTMPKRHTIKSNHVNSDSHYQESLFEFSSIQAHYVDQSGSHHVSSLGHP